MTTPLAGFDFDTVARALFVHPVKACAPVAVDELRLDERGGQVGDREWAIVDARGEVTWQGSHPRLALVHPRPVEGGMALAAEGFGEVLAPAAALAPCRVKIWSDLLKAQETFDAADAGPEAARWLAAVAGAPLRLVRLGADALAREGPAALHVVFVPSVRAVDAELSGPGGAATDVRRFRANIVLDAAAGCELDAFVEDTVQALAWRDGANELRLDVTAPCVRCIVPNVDPATARVDAAMLAALEALQQRRRPGAPTVFGTYVRGPAHARLRVGDAARLEIAF